MSVLKSIIDDHPQRDMIIAQLIAGTPVRELCLMTKPRVSHSAIQRYRSRVIKPAVAVVVAQNDTSRAPEGIAMPGQSVAITPQEVKTAMKQSPVRDRLESLHHRADRAMNRVEDLPDKDQGMMAPLIGQSLRGVELLAKLTGELQEDKTGGISIQVVIPSAASASASGSRRMVTFDAEAIDVTESTR